MKNILILLAMVTGLLAQYDAINTDYDFILFEVDAQEGLDEYNIRTFTNLNISFHHNADGLPDPGDIIVPDSLLNPTGNIVVFSVPNEPQYWTGDEFNFAFNRTPLGTGYYVLYVRTIGGFPATETDWSGGQPFLLRANPSVATGVGVSGN